MKWGSRGAERIGGVGVALATMSCLGVLAMPGSALAAEPAGLTGEHLMATAQSSSYFVPGTCYSGGAAHSSFSFSGTATGPYAGTYTETGTLQYTLRPVSAGAEIATGPVTGFSATLTITSRAGTVVIAERFDPGLSADQDGHCYESAGGTSFATEALSPTYTATITTARGTFRDHGSLAEALTSAVALGGSVADSSETADLTSAAPVHHEAKVVSVHHRRYERWRPRYRRSSPRQWRS